MSELHLQLEHLLETRRVDIARRVLERAFSESPSEPENHYYAARVADLAGDRAEATRQIGQLLTLAPDHVGGLSLAVELARKGKQHSLAEQHALELIRRNPERGHTYAQYALVMLETLHVEKARALTLEARRLSPEDELAHVLDVLTSIVVGEREQARQDLAQLVQRYPDALSVAWTLMTVLEADHRYRDALEVAKEVVRATPDDPDAVRAVIEFGARAHPLALPAWPLQRFGYFASIGLWIAVAVTVSIALETRNFSLAAWVGGFWIVYAVYLWTYLPLLRRWIRARGL
ncbi:tetratricopeptide repeat protein [Sorangium sp. So ce1078]|uniref:tetratricopeptide repeat protein n=1 Tax=Sorangium sp. So ce1078 TaxID=3133329 RepID=UPI003F5F0EB0